MWRTTKIHGLQSEIDFISIHVPRVEDDYIYVQKSILKLISIHVPRVEDDEKYAEERLAELNFNPRPPCGGRLVAELADCMKAKFQSTSPVWRTTNQRRGVVGVTCISIHVPRVEDDHCFECDVF